MKLKKILLSGLFLLISYCNSIAQSYNFTNYSVGEGLSQSEVLSIFQDSRGFIWIGTLGGGLNRFDGVNFLVYGEEEGLNENIITAITEDKNNTIWIGTREGGLLKFDGKNFTRIGANDASLSNHIRQLAVDNNNNIFIGTENGLSIYNGKSFIHFNRNMASFENLNINDIFKDSKGNIWIGTVSGLFVYRNEKLISVAPHIAELNSYILNIAENKKGEIFLCNSSNLIYKIVPDPNLSFFEVTPYPFKPKSDNSSIFDINFDANNNMWVSVFGDGLYQVLPDKILHFYKENGFKARLVSNIYKDNLNNLWFGTYGDGLYKLSNQNFVNYENVPVLNDGGIYAIYVDSDGTIYTGTNRGMVYATKNETTSVVLNLADKNEKTWIYSINKVNDELWIGASSGVYSYKNKSVKKILLQDSSFINIRAIYTDSKGRTWVGTKGKGLFVYENGIIRSFKNEYSYNPNIYCFTEDLKGNLVFGTGAGICVYDGKTFKNITEGLCNSYISSMTTDKHGNVWMGTDKCLSVFNGYKITSFDNNTGFPKTLVYLINKDKQNNIWVGTHKGVYRIVPNNDGTVKSFRHFDKEEGFTGIECNARSTYTDNDGNLYFGTIKGLIKTTNISSIESPISPFIHITNVKMYFEDIEWERFGDSLQGWFNLPQDHEFSYSQNHITFEFIGIFHSSPKNVTYKFMLEGFDSDWSSPITQNSFTYSNLPPGEYVFKVIACNSDNICNDQPAEYRFTILYPFWRTWLFYLICAGGLMIGVYYYSLWKKRQVQKTNLVLKRMVKERTAELEKQKEDKEILLKEIHHRVKNNLQIINSLINIQSANITDIEALKVFEESKAKIKSIALIHERLYKSDDLSNIDISEYINELVKSLVNTYSVGKEIKLITDLKVTSLNLNTVIPLGLLLNEIISNSVKYAFADSIQSPEIFIYLKSIDEKNYELTIGDNGVGYTFDPFTTESTTLGMELVKVLVEQLDGSIVKLNTNGTYYRITFKKAKN